MNKEKKLIKNSLIFAIGNIGTNIITFLMLPFYTLKLTQAQFGEIELLNSVVPLMVIMISCNLSAGVFRFSLDKNYEMKKIFSSAVIYSVVVYFLCFAILIFLNFKYRIYNQFYIIAVLIFLNIVQSIFKEFVRAVERLNIFIFSDFLHVIIFTSLNIFLIGTLNLGVKGFFYSKIVALFFESIFLFIGGRIHYYFNFKIEKNYLKEMIFYGLPLIPNSLMWWIGNLSDRYILNYYVGLEAVGLYSVAVRFPTIINTINGIFFKAWQISAIEEYGTEKQNEFYTRVFNIIFIFIIFLSSGFLMFIRIVMLYMVDEKFYISWRYIPFLLIACIFTIFGVLIGVTYVASKETINAVKTMSISAVCNVVLNFIFTPRYGTQGACFATMISGVIFFISRVKDTQKYVQIKYDSKNMLFNFFMLSFQIYLLLKIEELKISFFYQLICFFAFVILNRKYIKVIFTYILKRGKI